MTKIYLFVVGALPISIFGQIAVIDPANLEQTVIQVLTSKEQLANTISLLNRLGDPSSITTVSGVTEVVDSLSKGNLAVPLKVLIEDSPGFYGMSEDGGGLYLPIPSAIALGNGEEKARNEEVYRKFAVLQAATRNYHEVVEEAEKKRLKLRAEHALTLQTLQNATTDAEVQKLRGALLAQSTELETISAQENEALARVLVQNAANEADQRRQEQAQKELRAESLKKAFERSFSSFTVDTKPSLIPSPNR